LDALESWLAARQGDVDSKDFGDSIDQTEDMLKKHDDFKQMLGAQEDKVSNLMKDPSLAQAKKMEAKKDRDAKEKVEKQRLDELKKKEKDRLLEARGDDASKPSETPSRPRPASVAQSKEDSPAPDLAKTKAAAEVLKRSASSLALSNKPIVAKRAADSENYSSDDDDAAAAAMPPPQTAPSSAKTLEPPVPQQLALTMKPRKTHSFRNTKLPELPSHLPPPTIEGAIERKHTQQVGGKKAAIRSWNSYYGALCGGLLIFFKDKKSRDEMRLTSSMPPPLNVDNAAVTPAPDHKGRKNVFELKAPDGAEFLFDVTTISERDEWINAIGRVAGPPSINVAYDRTSINSDGVPPEAPMGGPPVSPLASLPVKSRDGDNLSTHSNESDSVPSVGLYGGGGGGGVSLRASTLPVGANRASMLSSDGEETEKKKKKGFGSFLKKKKDKS
jgi:spectrin beta